MDDTVRNLDIGLLRTLIHVAECGSMTGAARRLHMTQGAVSQQVKRLELALNQVILKRGKGGAGLTGDGERLLLKARQLVGMNDEILAARPAPEIGGQVRLGVPHDLMASHLPPILQAFAHSYPQVEIVLTAGSSHELIKAYGNGSVDLALMEQPLALASAERLSVEQAVWVGAAQGLAWTRRPLPICLVSDTSVFRPPLAAALAGAGIAWRSVVDYPGIEAVAATVQADLAVTALLASTVPPHLALLDQHAGLPSLPAFAITLHAPPHGASAACGALAQAIRDAYRFRAADR